MADPIVAFISGAVLPALWKKLVKLRAARKEALAKLGGVFGDPVELAKYYVEPNCQDNNPANYDESEAIPYVREPVFGAVNAFLNRQIAPGTGRNQLFVLSDAGMGKSSLLVMLRLNHLLGFWPPDTQCVLLKLGEGTLAEIEGCADPASTVLLLDALDEDKLGWGRIEERLTELLVATKNFKRTIISCRTQFFPQTVHDPYRTVGHVVVSGFTCPMKFLSLFDEPLVEAYLKKRFPEAWYQWLLRLEPKKRAGARSLSQRWDTLRYRPFLLAHIDHFPEGEWDRLSSYEIFKSLVSGWLLREEQKARENRLTVIPSQQDLWSACILVAEYLQRRGERSLEGDALRNLLAAHPELGHLDDFEFGGRSFLNKTSSDGFRFSHYSVQQFLVARGLLTGAIAREGPALRCSAELLGFLREGSPEKVLVAAGLDLRELNLAGANLSRSDLRGADLGGTDFQKADLEGANLEGAKLKGARLEGTNLRGVRIFGDNREELVFVPGGTFLMGSPESEPKRSDNEGPQHEVTLAPFRLAKHPVTNEQYARFLQANPGARRPKYWGAAKFNQPTQPVVGVSWDEANRYCEWAGLVLPTEAQWEYACRAGTTTPFSFGDDITPEQVNYDGNHPYAGAKKGEYRKHPVPAGSLPPNAWGLHEMHGNVWEWCQDWYVSYRDNPARPGDGLRGIHSASLRVLRGGSWNFSAGGGCRSACRLWRHADVRIGIVGFRPARVVT